MALSAVELAAQLRVTAAFIEADVVDLAVSRSTVSRVPGGGSARSEAVAAGSRRVRIIPGEGVKEQQANLSQGRQELEEAILFGMPDVDILEEDQFDYQGKPWRVATVTIHEYRLVAKVVANVG